ncbi:MAG: type II toxin-antitoxin system RelE/ParE family toxin [Clostridiales bacterium]|nr:type II toxin-antitoxin system RelE/ParE family toxin [Clostridiales bacterium]
MGKIQFLFYDAPDGTEPAKEFMQSLDVKMRAKMARAVMMLETNGGELREPISRPLGDGIYELRAQVGNNISRVLYFFFVGNQAILTNGFIKKTQKTPRREIDRAKRYRAEFLSREENKYDQL